MIGRAADAAKAATWRIYQYTRSQAVADGFQIEVTKTAEEAGIRIRSPPAKLNVVLLIDAESLRRRQRQIPVFPFFAPHFQSPIANASYLHLLAS